MDLVLADNIKIEASDAFTRADSIDLGPNWIPPAIDRNAQIVGNRVRSTILDQNAHEIWTAQTFTASQFAEITLVTWVATGATSAGVCLRGTNDGSTFTMYVLVAQRGLASTSRIYKRINSIFTELISENATTWVATDKIQGTVIGTTLTLYRNGIQLLQVTNSDIASGNPGLVVYQDTTLANVEIDNFYAENIDDAFLAPLAIANINSDDLNNLLDSGEILVYESPDYLNDIITFILEYDELINEDLNIWLDNLFLNNFYSKLINEDLNNWNEASNIALGLPLDTNDDLNNLNDLIFIGYGIALVEDETIAFLVDDIVPWIAPPPAAIKLFIGSNLNNNYEDLVLGIGLLIPDDLNNWLDEIIAINLATAISLANTDDLNNWSDVLSSFYLGIIDSPFSDDLNNLVETLSLIYSYESSFNDDLNLWLDFFENIVDLTLSDNLNNWNESLSLIGDYLLPLNDDLNSWNDALSLVESYQYTFTDDINNWLDSYSQINVGQIDNLDLIIIDDGTGNLDDAATLFNAINQTINTSDDLNTWLDVLALGYGLDIFEDGSNSWSERFEANFEAILSDDLNGWDDSIFNVINIPQILTDDLNNWLDVISTSITVSILTLIINEDLNLWLDAFSKFEDYGLGLNDNLNNWLDFTQFNIINLFDNLNSWNEDLDLRFHYGLQINDALVNWADDIFIIDPSFTIDTFISTNSYYRRYLVDTFQRDLADELGYVFLRIYDDNNTWFDTIVSSSIAAALALPVTVIDDLNNWLDAFTSTLPGIAQGFTDDLNNWNDVLIGLFAHFYDTNDDLNNWLEAIDLLSDYLLTISDDESANWLEAFVSGIAGNQEIIGTDDAANWLDAIGFIYSYEEIFSEDGSGNWSEAIAFGYSYELILSDDNSGNW